MNNTQFFVKMDWLTLTAPYENWDITAPERDRAASALMDWLRHQSTVLPRTETRQIMRNEPHYHFHYLSSAGWQLSLSARQSQGVRLVFAGSVLPVGHAEQREIYETLRNEGWRVTRCDVAVDVFNDENTIERLWHDGMSKQAFKRQRKTDLILSPNGDTISVGSRKSDKFMRVYDKAKEQHVEGDWIRYELETKYKTAKSLSPFYNDVIRGASATMLSMLDYYPKHFREWFDRVADGAESFRAVGRKSRGNREIWLMEQVLSALVTTRNENPALFDRFIDELILRTK